MFSLMLVCFSWATAGSEAPQCWNSEDFGMTTILSGFIGFIYLDDRLGQKLIYAKNNPNTSQRHNGGAKNGNEWLFMTKNCKRKIYVAAQVICLPQLWLCICDVAFVISFLFPHHKIKFFAQPNFLSSAFQWPEIWQSQKMTPSLIPKKHQTEQLKDRLGWSDIIVVVFL